MIHSFHHLLRIPEDIDIIIHSGDFSNYKDQYKNEPEMRGFINWYSALNIKHKILIAGNHDSYVFHNKIDFKKLCKEKNIIYLENESTVIEGIHIYGTPYTPTFGDWYFMKKREKLYDVWQGIPEETDILVIHGPPQKKLDLSYSSSGNLEYCGCKSLASRIENVVKPIIVCFGHIHSSEKCINSGMLYMNNIYYSNASVVTDNKFGKLTSSGNTFEIDLEKNIKIC